MICKFIFKNKKNTTLLRKKTIKQSYSCSLTYQNPFLVTYIICINIFQNQIYTYIHTGQTTDNFRGRWNKSLKVKVLKEEKSAYKNI